MAQGDHQAQMQEALALLEEGKAYEAEHLVAEMVATIESTGMDQPTMHLTMALSALRADDPEGAAHHMEHFLDMAEPDQASEGEGIMDLIHQEMIHDAQHQLEDFMGHLQGTGMADPMNDMRSEPDGVHP